MVRQAHHERLSEQYWVRTEIVFLFSYPLSFPPRILYLLRMNNLPLIPGASGLVCEDVMPLRCTQLTHAPTEMQRLHCQEANEGVLRTIALLDEHFLETGDEHEITAQGMQRIDFKLNLVLDLVGQVVAHHLSLPESVSVSFNTEAIQWEGLSAPDAGAAVKIELYVSRKYPRAIVLYGKVQAVQPLPGAFKVGVALEGLSEIVSDGLGKLIFRHHRRHVAHARRMHHVP